MTTNCNWSVDMVYYKAGIFGKGEGKGVTAADFKKMAKKNINTCIYVKTIY